MAHSKLVATALAILACGCATTDAGARAFRGPPQEPAFKPTRVIAKASEASTEKAAASAAESPAAEPHRERAADPRVTFAAWLKHHVALGA